MTPLEEFISVFCQEAESHCGLDKSISLDELPAEGGMYAETGEGFPRDQYYSRTEIKVIPVLVLSRDVSQARCLERLEKICNYYQRLKKYPKGELFSWLNVEIAKYPSKIGRDEDGKYHYSCILNCALYY